MNGTMRISGLCAAMLCVTQPAWARSWCARPLTAHEWGVQVFDSTGAPKPGKKLPAYFHHSASSTAAKTSRVADLPPDSGIRDLPVLHFYAGEYDDNIPVGVSVGFSAGEASAWFPQVDVRRTAAVSNSPAATAQRNKLLELRTAPRVALPDDTTKQLQWNQLLLTRKPAPSATAATTEVPWISSARAISEALWVNHDTQTERFAFYEAPTTERPTVEVQRGPTWAAGNRHYILRNVGKFAVHDVYFVVREGDALFVFNAPAIPANASAGFVVEQHRVSPANIAAATVDALRKGLVITSPASPTGKQSAASTTEPRDCIMMRDPAVPVESSTGFALFPREADLFLSEWHSAMFDGQGTTIVYREDERYLEQVMPLSIFTDMYHFVELHRASFAIWQNVKLP